MIQKNLLVVMMAVTTLASITAMNMVFSVFASNNAEPLAPGQGEIHSNPSDNQPPPGNPEQDDDRGDQIQVNAKDTIMTPKTLR